MHIPKQYTLGRTERLKRRKLIEQLFDKGKSFAAFPLRVYHLPLALGEGISLQAGVTVSTRHFKKAVDRNRIKRLMREAWRLQKGHLENLLQQQGTSLAVFILYTNRELPDAKQLQERMQFILQKLEQQYVRTAST